MIISCRISHEIEAKECIKMANKNIRKETKKKKKTDATATPSLKPMMAQPELVKKAKKSEQ
jgi:hypothetical protein